MGVLKEVACKPCVAEQSDKSQAPSRDIVKHHQYSSIESISNTDNESPRLGSIRPIGKNAVWACELNYDERTKMYSYSNVLYLIDSRKNVLQQVKLDKNIFMLETHPITKQLFYVTDVDKHVRSIDIINGKTTNRPVKFCSINIHRLKVTHDNHVIVGSCRIDETIGRQSANTNLQENK